MASINLENIAAIVVFLFLGHGTCWTLNNSQTLHDDLLRGYNKKLLPRLIQNETVEIRISFTLALIQEFNDLTGEISFLGIFQMQWREERFVWDPAQYGGQTEVLFPVVDVWTPELIMGNVEDEKKQPGRNAYRVRFRYDGGAHMESLDYLQSFCPVDVTEYPHDKQTCLFTIVAWGYTDSEVRLIAVENFVFSGLAMQNSAWVLTDHSFMSDTLYNLSIFNITMSFERRSNYADVNLFSPLIILSVMTPLAFLVPPESGERVSYSVTVFLSFTVYMGIVGEHLPKGSEPIAEVSYWLLCKIIHSAIIVFCTIVSLRLYAKGDKEPVPKHIGAFVKILRFRCFRGKKENTQAISSRTSIHRFSIDSINQHNTRLNSMGRRESENLGTFLENPHPRIQRDPIEKFKPLTQKDEKTEDNMTWYLVGRTFDSYMLVFSVMFVFAVGIALTRS